MTKSVDQESLSGVYGRRPVVLYVVGSELKDEILMTE